MIRTPSSTCASEASSASLCCKTLLPHSVLTKVVRPVNIVSLVRILEFELLKLGGHAQCRRTSSRSTANHQAKLDTLLDILLLADHLLKIKQLASYSAICSHAESLSRGLSRCNIPEQVGIWKRVPGTSQGMAMGMGRPRTGVEDIFTVTRTLTRR